MKLLGKLFWLIVFLAATFSWVALFEYGPSGFVEGSKKQWEELKEFTNLAPFSKKQDESDKIAQ